jgi:hypothetical protein
MERAVDEGEGAGGGWAVSGGVDRAGHTTMTVDKQRQGVVGKQRECTSILSERERTGNGVVNENEGGGTHPWPKMGTPPERRARKNVKRLGNWR